MNKHFVYSWDVNPEDSDLIGPFEDRMSAIAWIEEQEQDRNFGVMELPFETIKII